MISASCSLKVILLVIACSNITAYKDVNTKVVVSIDSFLSIPAVTIGYLTVIQNAHRTKCIVISIFAVLQGKGTIANFAKQREKKEEIWLRCMTKGPLHPQKNPKSKVTTQNATKNVDYKPIADRLRTASWGNYNHQRGVVKPVYGIPTFPLHLPQKPGYQKDTFKYNNAKRSIPAHPTFVNDTHGDLHLWTVTSKLIGFTCLPSLIKKYTTA